MKSEPAEFSIEDLVREGEVAWDGVRNYQVRNMMRDTMRVGDKALFYHSNTKPLGVVGEMEITQEAYPDPSQFDVSNPYYEPRSSEADPRWLAVNVRALHVFPRTVTLAEIKEEKCFRDHPIVQRGSRLSITQISTDQYKKIITLATH